MPDEAPRARPRRTEGADWLYRSGPARTESQSRAAKVGAIALIGCTAITAAVAGIAAGRHSLHNGQGATPPLAASAPPATDVPYPPPVTAAPHPTPRSAGPAPPSPSSLGPLTHLRIWLTGYSFQDNTPRGSAIVSAPILHRAAGGTGTYDDPITVAVPGHASDGNMAWKPGTRFYLPTVRRYVIVEDSGASPAPSGQDGHLDMWVDGQGESKTTSDRCMDEITGTGIPAIMNPPPDGPVMPGPITSNGTCHIPASSG